MSIAQFIQVYCCLLMTGVIWLVQVLVYPNFRFIDRQKFGDFHQFHRSRITWVVAPLMSMELASGIWMLYKQQSDFYLFNLISIVFLWAFTALVNVPIHNKLESNKFEKKDALVFSNWPRTIAWTLRSLVWFFVISSQSARVVM